MESREHVRTISLSKVGREGVLFEGDLGEQEEQGVLEKAVLTEIGAYGTMRIDQKEKELKQAITEHRADTEES